MSMLWLGVVVLSALALVFVFIPLLLRLNRGELVREQSNVDIYKSQLEELETEKDAGRVSQGDYEALVLEVKRNLLTDTQNVTAQTESENSGRWVSPVMAVFMIVGSVLLYNHLGFENELAITDLLERSNSSEFSKQDSEDLLVRLNDKVAKTPKDVEAWYMIGRIQFEMGDYKQSVKGFNGVLMNLPNDAKTDQAVAMAQLAQAKFFANNRQLDKSTQSLLEATLEINPRETTALGLLGVAAFDSQDYMGAVKYWRQLLALMPPNNPNTQAIKGGIEKALMQLKPEQISALQAEIKKQPAVSIKVTVDLAEEIRAQVPENADLFILAKAESGPPMPLAVKRLSNNSWPITVVLDDSMAMMPSLKMSNFDKVVITARISKGGEGIANPGDIEGSSGVIESSTKKASVMIDHVLK